MLPLTRNRSRSRFFSTGASAPSNDPNWANVALLLNTTSTNGAQNNTFLDSSTNAFTVTRNGDTTQGSFTPFAVPSGQSYSAATYGGSGYFDGTDDYLTPTSTAIADFGTSDFTVECWVNLSSLGVTRCIMDSRSAAVENQMLFQIETDNKAKFGAIVSGSVVYFVASTSTVVAGAWAHIAITRQGTTMRMFFNGALEDTQTNSTNFTQGTNRPAIGATGFTLGQNDFAGYISNLRVVKGTAVYTAAFTPPTTPLTAITNTSLLLNFTNAGIFDAATINNGQTVGNAQVSTTQAKWGTTSMYFDGTGDWLTIQRRVELSFGTGSFTIEGWINVASVDATYRCILSIGNPVQIYARSGTIEVYFNDSDDTVSYIVNGQTGPASSITANTWAHFAVVRNGTTFTTYVNGVGGTAATGVSAAVFYSTVSPLIGVTGPSLTLPFTGYIQDLRITNGVARYTGNFTPPTAAFPTL